MKSTRFLFFLYHYPPAFGTAPRRNFAISSAIASKAQSAIIYTSSEVSEKIDKPENVEIISIPAIDYRSILRRKTKDGSLPESRKSNFIVQHLVRLINTFPFSIIAGEGGMIYFLNLIYKGQHTIRKNGITHLYSSYRPFIDHYAAYWLKKRNPELIWIADFRDLIIDPHYNHIFYPSRHHQFFKKIFSKADILTTVSDGLAIHLKEYNPVVITVRNGITDTSAACPLIASPFFTMAYTGSMFLDKRNAQPLFQALLELLQETKIEGDDIRIVYAGKDSMIWKDLAARYHMSAILEDLGIVSAAHAEDIQRAACVNVLLSISSDQLQGVLTGKMIEYFKSGSPVLGLIVGQNDPELSSILHELEIGESFSDQDQDIPWIKAFIYKEYLHWKSTGKNRKPINLEVLKQKYAMDAVMQPLFERIPLNSNPT